MELHTLYDDSCPGVEYISRLPPLAIFDRVARTRPASTACDNACMRLETRLTARATQTCHQRIVRFCEFYSVLVADTYMAREPNGEHRCNGMGFAL